MITPAARSDRSTVTPAYDGGRRAPREARVVTDRQRLRRAGRGGGRRSRSTAGTSRGSTVAPPRSARRGATHGRSCPRVAAASALLDVQTGGAEVLGEVLDAAPAAAGRGRGDRVVAARTSRSPAAGSRRSAARWPRWPTRPTSRSATARSTSWSAAIRWSPGGTRSRACSGPAAGTSRSTSAPARTTSSPTS